MPVSAWNRIVRACGLMTAVAIVGCSGGGATAGNSGATSEENPIFHEVTPEDLAAAESKTPLTSDSVVLWVNGLGCPLCASALDVQILRVKGVGSAVVDLSVGKVTVGLRGAPRPSAWQLGEAVRDAGFTLMKVETN